ncbi:MAG: GNAT family N-acetyltransferase [Verrucomicrobiae bacterium]|nr:GNAT family N-acetyltransferase [Verrucomicrobiae bacterium]
MSTRPFLSGVIEGFYGEPWSVEQRERLFRRMRAWGLNTYFYAPKDDLQHRALWREPYDTAGAARLGDVIRACQAQGLRFVYGLAPGLDIAYSDPAEVRRLEARCGQLMDLGCRDFALLFDDIPDGMSEADRRTHGTFARAQAAVATRLWKHVTGRAGGRFLFCPTPYCERMVRAGLGGDQYLETLGTHLPGDIDVLWTGPEIVSREITVASLEALARRIGRAPMLWDNLHANDYDLRRLYLGPYSGRDPAVRGAVSGVLSNPNCEFEANWVALRTLALWIEADPARGWDPREAYLQALREWWPAWDSARQPIAFEDLVLLGDCLYLPYENGAGAVTLAWDAAWLLANPAASWGERVAAFRDRASRLVRLFERLSELRDRGLFYALNRRAWEVKEEMTLLLGAVAALEQNGTLEGFRSDFHLPHTFRGGFMRSLETLLVATHEGGFRPGPGLAHPPVEEDRTLPTGAPATIVEGKGDGSFRLRPFRPGDEAGAYEVCLKTGDHGADGEPFYREDPDALGRIYVGPYLAFEPDLAWILEDDAGVAGYVLGALDSKAFYRRYTGEWCPALARTFPEPTGDPSGWTRVQQAHFLYHHPETYCPEPYDAFPSHLHIDLLPRAQGRGWGRRMIGALLERLRQGGSPGVHLGVSWRNSRAEVFYRRLGFRELTRTGTPDDGAIYLGLSLKPDADRT